MILDVIASRSVFAVQRALKPNGTYYCVGGSVGVMLQTVLFDSFIRRARNRSVRVLIVRPRRADLIHMAELCAAGEITPMIDPRRFALHEAPQALRHLGEGHARGKVILRMDGAGDS
jgi:NADPH:quinone reductase-like Zn-dependent oxidoreductase